MARRRVDLDAILRNDILQSDLSENCYYIPPSDFEMCYPCIRYDFLTIRSFRADNIRYVWQIGYQVTVIDEDPDSEIVLRLLNHPTLQVSFERKYTADGLNHFVFTVFY